MLNNFELRSLIFAVGLKDWGVLESLRVVVIEIRGLLDYAPHTSLIAESILVVGSISVVNVLCITIVFIAAKISKIEHNVLCMYGEEHILNNRDLLFLFGFRLNFLN